MVYVHLVKKDIPAPADDVWQLLGPNFADIIEWSTKHTQCRTLTESEIPKKYHPSKHQKYIKNSPVRGRVVRNLFYGSGELAQTITMYSDARKELTYACAFPLPIVDTYECTIIVVEPEDKSTATCTVEMECDFCIVPGFCWLGELLGLRGRLRTDGKGPAGDLQDIKTYFEKKKQIRNEKKFDK
jgi:hypothetical protein